MVSESDHVGEATTLLRLVAEGDGSKAERLLELVYDELRRLAGSYLARERADHTLQPTALVHEAYLKLIDQKQVAWQNRAHFLGLAAQAMRRILVDHARGVRALKRGGDWQRVELTGEESGEDSAVDLVDLDGALAKLAGLSERRAQLVELRFFGGLEVEEIARLLDTSESTLKREWRFARAWLTEELRDMQS